MATPITPSTARALSITPGSRVLKSPLSDDAIWKRLKEAGFDEEAIKRRDKAALIAYIAKLEAEVYDYQHQMGLLLLEKKEFDSKYEQVKLKSSAEVAEIMHKRDQAAHLSALAEARKREENLKKALGVEKECIASLEKALHEMRAESAEAKVAAESKLAEAHNMMEDAQKKFVDAEVKLRSAESLQAEASRFHRSAERKLQEVETREEDLGRRIMSFKAECDAKEKEIILERQSLSERQKILQQEHERLLDGQALLNQREEYIFSRSEEVNRLEKELEVSKETIEKEQRVMKDEKSRLDSASASLLKREENFAEREALLDKKEQELLASQEKLSKKESDDIQKVVAAQETALRTRKSEFEAELEIKRKMMEDEIETKRRVWELREIDISQREDVLREKDHELEVQSRILANTEKDVVERSNLLDDREKILCSSEKEIELKVTLIEREKEEINRMKLELQKLLSSLEDRRSKVDCEQEKLEAMRSETNELSVLELKLKEELDLVRAQKLELIAEADKLKIEKAKFEAEWELIDEKREELQMEAERVAKEREAVSKFVKDEQDSLRKERDAMREQYNHDVESLNHEREDFMNKMAHEHSECFSKIQQERADFLMEIEIQKKELENCIEKKRDELESSLREREEAFEQEKKSQLEYINGLKERAEKELEQISLEMKKLDAERMDIKLDREQRERDWADLNNSIQKLDLQREKLQEQRELLHADRKRINAETEELRKLGDLKAALDDLIAAQVQHSTLQCSQKKISAQRNLTEPAGASPNFTVTDNGYGISSPTPQPGGSSPLSSARFSWIRRCSELIFKHSTEKNQMQHEERPWSSDIENAGLTMARKLDSSDGSVGTKYNGNGRQTISLNGEPKVMEEMACEGDVVKGMQDLESEIKENYPKKSYIVSEEGLQATRKRRADHLPHELVDPSLQDRLDTSKKRKQEKDSLINSSEVPSEKTDGDGFSDLENIEQLQEFVGEEIQEISHGEGTYSQANAIQGVNDESGELEMVQGAAHFQNVFQVTEHSKSLEATITTTTERIATELKEDVAAKQDVSEKIGGRRRSKMKL
ncbi:hypothetical protein SLA2020_205750 [Shorea laevis]